MSESSADCVICRGPDGDAEFERFQVWEDRHWRLTVSLAAEVPGFAYLEPKRHVPHITELDGPEAKSFGEVLARNTKALCEAFGRTGKSVRLLGVGVRFASTAPPDAAQLALL